MAALALVLTPRIERRSVKWAWTAWNAAFCIMTCLLSFVVYCLSTNFLCQQKNGQSSAGMETVLGIGIEVLQEM